MTPGIASMQDDDERLRQAVRAGNIGIFEHDHTTDVIFWSLELRQMYGWDATEPAVLSKILSHVHPEDTDRVVAAVRRAHDPEGDGAFDIEHRIVDRHHQVRWVLTRSRTRFGDESGQRRPIRTIGAVQDVTDRVMAAERLRVLDTVLRSSAQAIAIADRHGTLTFANAALHRLLGHSEHESLLGRSLFELWKTDDDPAIELERIKEDRIRRVEIPVSRVDGSRFYVGIAAEAVCDSTGALSQLLVTFSDVTDRKRLEETLIHAQKMESVGRLAGGVAHDFNNFLAVIFAGLELSLSSLPPGHPSRAHLLDVSDAAHSTAALTRQLLAFSRKEIIAPKVLDLNVVIRRVERMILRLLGEDVELRTICGEDVAPVLFDPTQVEQIIVNLAVNARDAMAQGGRLLLETSNVRLNGEASARHSDARPGTYVRLAVSDNGSGLSDEARAHLFEPFFTTKGPGKGTGLGLAMVYGAVQQNGGWIEVDSEPNRGTTFKIYLPAAKGIPHLPATRTREPTGGASARILLVEDEPRLRRIADRTLKSFGYEVLSFANGADALSGLESLAVRPDLLVTDVVMPGMNGMVLAERIAALVPGIRVLFVSGHTENWILEHGILKSGIEFLAKPYSIDQLARRIREVLGSEAAGILVRPGPGT